MIYDFDSSGAIVLTTPEPGAFLNFRWESGDSSYYFIPQQTSDVSAGKLWINGLDISLEASIYDDTSAGYYIYISENGDPSIASFFLYTREFENFDVNLQIERHEVSMGGSLSVYDISVLNRPYIVSSEDVNIFKTSNIQVEGEASYLILRTNPKFSGNVKLVIDPSDNLFMDTFKVSDILSNKLYRKQRISGNSVFSGDIRKVFSSLPQGEIYKLSDGNILDIAIPKTNYYDQYDTNYSYGARLLIDELYEEDYAMLAPLWISRNLPDYFVIFRVSGTYNEETYSIVEETWDLSRLANKFLEEGKIVKSWEMKENSPVGIYLRNHLEELEDIISPMFLSLSDPDLKDPDPNTWYGVAVDKGIITGRSETTYFFDQNSKNFTDLNAFSSGGFERLNLLCPNLINMEYVFNDIDVSLYEMNKYYGLYLTENPLYKIAYYADADTGIADNSISIISLDEKDSSTFFQSVVFNSDGSIIDSYKNRLFTINDSLSVNRITNINQVDGAIKSNVEKWLNKPGDNLFSAKVENINTLLPFISFEIKNKLSSGEHLRIIDNSTFIIWEIYGSDVDILSAGESWNYATEYSSVEHPIIYRTIFSIKGEIEDQNEAIWNAWNVFQNYSNTPFETYRKKTYGQSLILKDRSHQDTIKFQRLTAQTTDTIFDSSTGIYDASSNFNSAATYGDIEFYGNLIPTEDDFERLKYDSSYGPINFELYGDRMSITIDIYDPSNYSIYSMDASIVNLFDDNMLYLGTNNWYRLVQNIDISTNINNSLSYTEDPTTVFDKIIIFTEDPIITIDGFWNAYAVYPLIISLMGINSVKDFDYTVYDSSTVNFNDYNTSALDFKSEYWYKREGDVSTFNFYINKDSSGTISNINSFQIVAGDGSITIDGDTSTYASTSLTNPFIFNTFDSSASIDASSLTIITYAVLDGSTSFKSYKEGYSEELIKDYYVDYDSSDFDTRKFYGTKSLKYGLTVPTITKWATTGNDCRNNPLRLILDVSIFDVSSNFIPDTSLNFAGEIFYPSFKYLTAGARNWEDYIFYDINDSIKYVEDGSTYYSSFKNLMFSHPEIDIFSKLVYSNYGVDRKKSRSSIVYYNNYKNTVDTIISGLNLSFNIVEGAKNTIDIKDWDRFRISAVAVPSRNRDNNKPMEVFINENTETILLVWYQGNDILNYNYRYSSTIPGKGGLDPSIAYEDVSSTTSIQWRGFDNTDKRFSHVKTPFGVNNASFSTNIFNIYGIYNTYSGSVASPFLQTNLSFSDDLFSIYNAYAGNTVLGSSFDFHDSAYETFRQYITYDYSKLRSTYGNLIANLPYSYIRNENLYQDRTCDLDTLENILNNNNIRYYIFRKDILYTSSDFSINPVSITINSPNIYNDVVTYNGWYKPKFNNILEFSYNENKDIMDTVEKDFIMGNTDVKSYNNIPQLWFNKVVNEVTSYDVSSGNAIDYEENFNPFKSQWDQGYYHLYSNTSKFSIDGYNSTLELPSFFGSKLIKLPRELILDSWSNVTTDEEYTESKKSSRKSRSFFGNEARSMGGKEGLYLSYNLTRRIVDIFKGQETFLSNWSGLTSSDSDIIDGYIKNTILKYYNISKPKIKVEIWTKPYKRGDRLAYVLNDTFTKWEGTNIDGNLIYINDEYIYKIRMDIYPYLIYFVKFTLFEI